MYRIIKAVFFFIILSGALITSTYYLIAAIKSKFTDHQQVTMETILATTSLGLSNWKKQVVGEFNMWLNSPVVSEFTNSDFSESIDAWLNNMTPYTSASSIYFSDLSGVIVASSSDMTGQYIDNAIRVSLTDLDIGDYRFKLIVSRDSTHYTLLFSLPLILDDYDIKGYAHFELDLTKEFSDILESAHFGETGKVLAIGSDTSILNGTYGELGLYVPPKNKKSEGKIKILIKDGEQWASLYKWFEPLNCWLLIKVKYSEIYSIFQFIERLIVAFSLIVFLVFCFTFFQFFYFNRKSEKNNLIYKTSFFESSDIRMVLLRSGKLVDWSLAAQDILSLERNRDISIKDIGVRNIFENFNKTIITDQKQSFNVKIKDKVYSGNIGILKSKAYEYILIECRDITRQADYARKMKDKEERLTTTMQATNQGYFDLNFEANTEYFDSSLIEMLGFSGKVKVDRGVLDSLVHPDDFNTLVEMNTKIFESKSDDLISYEVRMRTKNNKWRYILIKSKAVSRDSLGRAKRIVGVHTDVTPIKQAQIQLEKEKRSVLVLNEELQKAAKVKDTFIATMSHELRTPLNSIISFSELMLSSEHDNLTDKQNEHIKVIERSARHLLAIINDILDLSQVNTGKMILHYSQANFEFVMESVLSMVASLADEKEISLKFDNQLDVDDIFIDVKRFKQIMINLLSNAIKFTGKGRVVGVNCRNTDSSVIIDVWDQGIGISEENMKKLFSPFVQIDSELSRNQEGTGLGLSLVKNMVELHKGTIKVKSKEGEGSTFTVVLPLKRSNEEMKPKGNGVFF